MQNNDLGLLITRLGMGGMMLFAHGLPKLIHFTDKMDRFPSLFGLPSSVVLGLAVFSEVFCAAAIMLGVFTRYAAVPLAMTMLIAAFVIHGSDPWKKQEFALLYAVPFIAMFFTGGGKYSLENFLGKK